MIDGNVEKPLDLRGVQVHGENSVRAGARQNIGNEFCRDGISGTGFSVLPRIAEVGNDRRDPARRRAARGVDHDQKFHQVVVDGRARGLDEEHVLSPDRFAKVHGDLSVAERADFDTAQNGFQFFRDGFRQRLVGVARKQLDFVTVCYHFL